jgi:acetyl-CoA C-acetyltransferase
VLTAAQGQNAARQAAIKAGIPDSATAFGMKILPQAPICAYRPS